MSFLSRFIGPGFSGYAILGGIPIPLSLSSATETENVIKAAGAYHNDPEVAVGPWPVRNRRSLPLSFSTFICPATMPLVKQLTYGWRNLDDMDWLEEVDFVMVSGNREGYEGKGYVDEISLTCTPGTLVTFTISMTCWVWSELGSLAGLPSLGGVFGPMTDAYKPVAGWQTIPSFSGITGGISQGWTLSIKNNWNYGVFLDGYPEPPNPALIVAGDLDVIFSLSWVAARNTRPADYGALALQVGVPPLDTIFIDRLIRDPQIAYGGIGAGNDPIKWEAAYYGQGAIPRSS